MLRRLLALTLPATVLGLGLPALAAPAEAGPVALALPPARAVVAAFSVVAPQGASPSGLVARAIIAGGTRCPALKTRNARGHVKSTAMSQRRAPDTTEGAFASLVACSAPIPAGAVSAHVRNVTIPARMPTRVDDVAIYGDTGCRLKGSNVQSCNDPQAWPLASLSSTIAASRPDLIIFMGDFFYREIACPSDSSGACAGSPAPGALPFKDSAGGWAADVFTPMAAALAAAPIVVVRGNHEDCNRGGNGYFIYMDPREGTEGTCAPIVDGGLLVAPPSDVTDPYFVDIAVNDRRSLRLVVVDSAGDEDCTVTSALGRQQAAYTAAQGMARRASGEAWLLVHRPVIGWQVNDDCAPTGSWVVADQQAASYGKLAHYDLLVSSHVHLVQSMNIPGVPGQLVMGNGSTLLEQPTPFALPTTGPSFDSSKAYPAPTSGWWDVRFGFAMAHPSATGAWSMEMKDPLGDVFAQCSVAKKRVDCS